MTGMGQHGGEPTHGESVDAEIEAILAGLEGATHYRDWLLELAEPYLGGRVLEIGAGRGTYSPYLRELGDSLVAVEPASRGADEVRRRVAGLVGVEVVEGVLGDVDPQRQFDSAVMLNVLEHIEDDLGVLSDIRSRLVPGGTLVVWVPAFPALLGEFDRRIGHIRRYRRTGLIARARTAGFEVVDCRHANLPGFLAWWLIVRVLRLTPTSGGLASLYDRWVVGAVRAVERRARPPFGQSLLLVARAV